MRRLVLLLALAACSKGDDVRVGLAPTLLFPRGLFDTVNKVTVEVLDKGGGATCNATTGETVKGTSKPLATKDLQSTGCAGGAKFCGDLQVDKSGDERVFSALAYEPGNSSPVAQGCTLAKVDQSNVQLTITMKRFVPVSMCGTKVSPVPVQCASPGSPSDTVCDENCISREVWLSKGEGTAGGIGSAKPKSKPVFLWAGGRHSTYFGDKSTAATQIGMRLLDDDMHETSDFGASVAQFAFILPNDPAHGYPWTADLGAQFNPTAAFLNAKYYVAFEDSSKGAKAIGMRSIDVSQLKAEQGPGASITISDTTPQAQALPSMATAGSKIFVAWDNGGTVVGKTVDAAFVKGTQGTVGTGTNPVVAAAGTGWVVAYQSGSDIKLRQIGADGTAGTEVKVNDGTHSGGQEHPGVAVLPSGVIAVVWADTGAQGGAGIFVQRFSSALAPVTGDQVTRINDQGVTGASAQSAPCVGAGSSYFVAAWADADSGHIRGRLLDDKNGFLFNSVNGQSSDFQVSLTAGRQRTSPTVAVGGAGPFIVIGWEDATQNLVAPDFAGIFGRRLPLP